MRLLVTFVGGLGHLAPLLPLARAVRDAGHVVAIAGSGGLVPRIEEAGFIAFATSSSGKHKLGSISRRRGGAAMSELPLHPRPSYPPGGCRSQSPISQAHEGRQLETGPELEPSRWWHRAGR